MANEWSQELLSKIDRATKDFESAALSGDSRIPAEARQEVIKNALYDYYSQQNAAQKRAARNAVSANRQNLHNAANDLAQYTPSDSFISNMQGLLDNQRQKIADLEAENNSSSNYYARSTKEGTAESRKVEEQKSAVRQKALEQARAEEQRMRSVLESANAQRKEQNNKSWMDRRLAQNRYDYGAVIDEANNTVKKLQQDKTALDQLIKSAKANLFYNPKTGEYEKYDGDIEQYRKELNDRYSDLTRRLADAESFQKYAGRFMTSSLGAQEQIKRGLQKEGELLAQQSKNLEDVNQKIQAAVTKNDRLNTTSAYNVEFRRADTRDLHPTEEWTEDAKNRYLYRLGKYGQEDAEEFAAAVNMALKEAKLEAAKEPFREFGRTGNLGALLQPLFEKLGVDAEKGAEVTNVVSRILGTAAGDPLTSVQRIAGNFGIDMQDKANKIRAGAAGIAGEVLSAPSHAMSYLDKLESVMATGRYTGRDNPTFSDYTSAITQGRAEQLNKEYGTIDKDKFAIGGKGLGDAYQLLTSMAQSLAYGNALGEAGTLAAFFFNSADSAFDEAKARGASDQNAAIYSFLSGAAEAATEVFSVENLLKGKWEDQFVKTLLKQAGIEGSEEFASSVLGLFNDKIAAMSTGERTEIQNKIDALVAQGMSRSDAEKQVWREVASDIAWDTIGGIVSGFGSGAIQGAPQAIGNKLWDMRKDAVLGKQNAEGQRSTSKTNVTDQELRNMIDRALKRGDITGAEQLMRMLEEQNGQTEEQEYGPADPRANERMQGRLARQLNGEKVNLWADDAETSIPVQQAQQRTNLEIELDQQQRDMRQQETARQQSAPSGQITQPSQQNATDVVKPDNYGQQQRGRNFPYTLDDVLTSNKGKKSVKEWVDILHNAVQQNPALIDMILDSPASNFTQGNTAFGRAIKQLRAEYSVSTSGTESGTIATPNTQAIESSERTKASPQLEELISKAVASEKAKSESKETGTRFGTWFPSSQTDSKTTSAETKKDIATVKSSAKGNEYLRNDYRANISFAGNRQMYRSVSEAMADPSVAREYSLEDVVRAKFQQNRELREKLFATGDAQIDPGTELGKILENVREELRSPDSPFNGRSAYEGAEDMGFNEFSDLLSREEERKREAERKLLEKFGYKEEENGELGTLSDSDGRRWGSLGNDGQRGTGLPGEAGQTQGRYQQENRRSKIPAWVTEQDAKQRSGEVSGKEQTGDLIFKPKKPGFIQTGDYIYGYGSYRIERPATGTVADFVLSRLAKAFGVEKNVVLVSGEIAVAGRPLERVVGFSNGARIACTFKQYGSLREMTYGIRNFIHEVTHHVFNDKFGGYDEEGNISDFGAYFDRKNAVYRIVKGGFVSKDIAGNLKQPVDALCDFYLEDRGYVSSYASMGIEAEAQSRFGYLGTFGVTEALRACVSEEIINDILGGNNNIMKAVEAGFITEENIFALREYFLQKLLDEHVYEDGMVNAIREAHKAIGANDFLYANGAPFVRPRAQAEMELAANGIDANIDVNLAVRRAFAGDIRHMEDVELFAVLNYALDRASPSTKGKNISERLSDLYIEYGNSATSYISEMGDYLGRHVGKLSEGKTDNLMRTVDAVLRELDRRDVSIDYIQSDISDYENNFGIATRYEKAAPWDTLARNDNKGNVSYAVSKRGRQMVELDQEYKPLHSEEVERKNRDDFNVQSREAAGVKTDDEIEEEFDAKRKPAIMRSLEKGNDIVESFGTNQPNGTRRRDVPVNPAKTTQKYQGRDIEDTGWIKPVETSRKDVKQARKAVEAKNEIAEYKEKKALLQAQVKYLGEVAKAMRTVRSHLFGSGDIEQRREDLNYLIDNTREQIEQLDADIGYLDDELGVDLERGENDNEEKLRHLLSAMDDATIQRQALSNKLDSLVDEVEDMYRGDSAAAYQNVRRQIDDVIEQINRLNVSLNGANGLIRQTEKAGWGSNKRTMFQAEMAENPNGLRQKQTMSEPNVYGPYKIPELNKVFRQQIEAELDVDAEATDIKEPVRGMGTGYRGMQTSRNKDGSLEFRTMYDDALPTRPATDKSRKAINAPSTAYGSVAQAARSILNSKSSFLDFSKDRAKDIPSKVTNTMGQLHEHVREMMEGEHPVNALMQLSNMVHEFAEDDDLRIFSSDSIQHAVDELNDIYYNQDITNKEKAKRMVENATKTLTLVSKRIQLVDKSYNMLKSFVGPGKKRDDTNLWSKYKAMQLNPSTLFKAMDGFNRGKNGSGYQIAKMIENGTALYTITQAQALQKLSAISGMEGFKEFSEGNTKPFDIDGVKITEQQAVEFIMQVRNLLATEVTGKDGPTNRLNTIEGFSIRDKDGKSTFIERSNDPDVTNAEWYSTLADSFEKSLSPAAKKYLEAATEILDDLGQQASDIRTNLIGTGFEGSINGTYYPITYDNKNGTSYSQDSKPGSLADGPMYQSRTRNVGGYVSIKNASDTLDKYIHWASNFIGYGEVAELLHTMNNTGGRMQNLSGLANEMLGEGYSKYIGKYVDDINENPDVKRDDKSLFATLRKNMASGALLGNLGVAAKQAASLWSAAGVLSPQAILSAETWFGKYSGAGNMLLQSRKIGTSLDPTISEILHNDSFMGKLMKRTGVSEFMGKATALVDYQTVKRLFAATVVDTKLGFPGLDQNSELFAQAVEAKFQDVVLQTQPIFVKNARAGYLRANDELMKAFAMFRTQPTQNLNAIVTAIGEYNALKGTEYGKAAGKKLRNTIIGQTASAVTFAALSSLVGFVRHGWKKFRDDDDELSWLEVAKRIGLDSVESLAGLTVVGGDIAKAIITMATGGEEKEFYDMNTGVLSMLGDTLSSVTTFGTNVVKAIQEGKPLAVFNAGRQAADNVLQVGLGIPANTVYRLLNTITMYSADALYALSDGKLGNRANYDDAMKMLDSYIKGTLSEEGAKTQAAKAYRKDQPENLLYNLGILSSLSTSDTDKGRVWLQNHLPKDEDKSVNRRILDYLISNAVSNEQMDEAVEKYVTADGFNAMYAAVRDTGVSPQSAIATIDAADGDKNGEFTQNELWGYYKANQSKDKQVGAMFDAKGYTKDGQPRTWDSYKAEQEQKEFKTVVDMNSNGKLTQAELLEYYRQHPDEEDKIKELWESNGWKTTWSSYKAKNAS